MIRALIVVEVPFYREGLAEILRKSADVDVVAAVGATTGLEELVASERPDVVLIDASLADAAMSIERIRARVPAPKLVALAVNETPDAVVRWAELGVAAYVPRSASPEELLRVLNGVAHEEFFCPPRIAARLMHHVGVLASGARRANDAFQELSPREHEVLSLMARGLPNKAIANTLSISHATAKNHVHNILEKLQLHRRSEVVSLMHEARPPR